MSEAVRLSQCMIVKNEEKNIERALSWGKALMWEQIVVDTGSTDRTEKLAGNLGAKLYHFSWTDNFAAAKNYAIEQAKGDWIIFLDADEYFTQEDAQKLRLLLEKLENSRYNAVSASWLQVDGSEDILSDKTGEKLKWQMTVKADGSRGMSLSGTQIRVFRNHPGLRYRGRIHEKIYMENGGLYCYDASEELAILHTGYTSSELEEKQKVERNIALIKKELELCPDDYKMMTYLGDSYFQQKKMEESLYWYRQAARHMPEHLEEGYIQGTMIFKHLMLLSMEISDEEAAKQAYLDGSRRFPQDADFDYLLGRHYAETGRYQEGAYHLQRALELLEQYGSDGIAVLLAPSLLSAWELLVICHYENGSLQACVNSAVILLRADPWRMETLKTLLLAFKKDEEQAKNSKRAAASASQVVGFLGNIYDLQDLEKRAFVKRAGEEAGYTALVECLG